MQIQGHAEDPAGHPAWVPCLHTACEGTWTPVAHRPRAATRASTRLPTSPEQVIDSDAVQGVFKVFSVLNKLDDIIRVSGDWASHLDRRGGSSILPLKQ